MKIINFPRALLFFEQLFQEVEEKQTTSLHEKKKRPKKRNVSINASSFWHSPHGYHWILFLLYNDSHLILRYYIKGKLEDKKMQCFINKWPFFSVCFQHLYDNSMRTRRASCVSRMINRWRDGNESNSTRKWSHNKRAAENELKKNFSYLITKWPLCLPPLRLTIVRQWWKLI